MRNRESPDEIEPVGASSDAPAHDWLGLVCCGALAFIVSSIGHEVIGHGGAAVLTGAPIKRISSVYFDAVYAGPIVDAAGPLMNLLVSALTILWQRRRPPASAYGRFLICAIAALNLMWGFGYFFFSGLTGRGDWAFLFRGSSMPWVWRSALMVVGVYGYRRSITIMGKMLTAFAPQSRPPGRALFRPAILLYLSAGATCCLAALFYRGEVGRALHESAIESFGAFLGLWFVAPRTPDVTLRVPRDWRWIAMTSAIVALYVAILGRGYFGSTA